MKRPGILTICLFLTCVAGFADVTRVLLLNSYHHGYAWTDDMTQGVIEGLPGVSVHVDFMDTKRQYTDGYLATMRDNLVAKYRSHSFDAIVCTDNNAFDFMRGPGQELFPEVPVVYAGVNFLTPETLVGLDHFTGVSETTEFGPSFEAMRSLFPERYDLWVVVDSTVTGSLVEAGIREALDLGGYGFRRIHYLTDLAIGELESAVSILGPQDILFYAFFFRDADGLFLESTEGISRVAAESEVPIFTSWDFNLGYGALGGYVAEAYAQGREAARLVQATLRAEPGVTPERIWDTPERLVFDFRELRRFSLDPGDLPLGAVVRYEPETPWYRYRSEIISVLVVIGVLAGLLVLAAANLRIRRAANETLELKVAERTEELEAMVRTLKATQDRLVSQERLGAVGSMVSGIAHEINTPLGVGLTGITHLKDYLDGVRVQIDQGWEDVDEMHKAINHAAQATDLVAGGIRRTAELVDRFRQVALDRMDLHRRRFRLLEYLEDITETFSHQDEFRGLVFELSGEELKVEGYQDVYRQILAALASNSRTHAYPAGSSGKVGIELQGREGGKARLVFYDEGSGIPDEHRDHVFEPFFAFRSNGQSLGLGLHVVYRLVKERLGGTIEYSRQDGRTVFTLEFPLEAP